MSGAPLKPISLASLTDTIKILGPRRKGKLLIAAGGIMTPQDVQERLEAGADLVQVYSTLIFNGPFFFRSVAEFMEHE